MRTSGTEEFEELRPMLFSIAYRILGSVSEAEDAVQETWLRFASSSTVPTSTKAFLSATGTRIAIDVLRSARVRREVYVGQWLPEPLLTDPYEDPARSAELADSLSMAALLLEWLSPLERAVFVLREVFSFGFPEIAVALDRSEAACRQLAVRARRHMEAGRPRFEADRREQEELAERFFVAVCEGDVQCLRDLFAADAQMIGDGGGKAPQLARVVVGTENVARLLASYIPLLVQVDVRLEPQRVNGQPGALFRDRDGKVLNAWTLDVLDGQIQTIRSVSNPDKLGHLGPVADAWAVNREANQTRHRTERTPPARGRARPPGGRVRTRVGSPGRAAGPCARAGAGPGVGVRGLAADGSVRVRWGRRAHGRQRPGRVPPGAGLPAWCCSRPRRPRPARVGSASSALAPPLTGFGMSHAHGQEAHHFAIAAQRHTTVD